MEKISVLLIKIKVIFKNVIIFKKEKKLKLSELNRRHTRAVHLKKFVIYVACRSIEKILSSKNLWTNWNWKSQ